MSKLTEEVKSGSFAIIVDLVPCPTDFLFFNFIAFIFDVFHSDAVLGARTKTIRNHIFDGTKLASKRCTYQP